MPEPRDHTKDRGWIESILRKIPGFKGYLEKEYRRDSDALQRDWLAGRLERGKRALDTYGRTLVDAGKLDALIHIDRVKKRIDQSIGRIRGAMQGYSGFFDLVQVDEARLDKLYEQDIAMMDSVDTLSAALEKLEHATAETPFPAAALNEQLGAVELAIDRRGEVLKGLE